jgi:hypothetical protein
MGRRMLSLLLFVAGYLLLATLEPMVAAGPALISFVAASLVLARESEPARIWGRRAAAPGGGAARSTALNGSVGRQPHSCS